MENTIVTEKHLSREELLEIIESRENEINKLSYMIRDVEKILGNEPEKIYYRQYLTRTD